MMNRLASSRERQRDGMKVKVTEKAVVARIKRKLARDGKVLCRNRSDSRWGKEIGVKWYIVDADNRICSWHIGNIGDLAGDIGALKEWEEIEFEDGSAS